MRGLTLLCAEMTCRVGKIYLPNSCGLLALYGRGGVDKHQGGSRQAPSRHGDGRAGAWAQRDTGPPVGSLQELVWAPTGEKGGSGC